MWAGIFVDLDSSDVVVGCTSGYGNLIYGER